MSFKSYDDLIKAAGINNYNFRAAKAVPGIHTLYCRRNLAASAIANNTDLKFFHKGIGDDMAPFGGTAGQTATLEDTNMQAEGRLPEGELFICTGLAFQVPHNIAIADYLGLADCTVSWVENAGSRKKVLGQFEEFPAQVAPDYILANNGATTGLVERLVRARGRAFISGAPLFSIKGGVTQHEQGNLVVNVLTGFTPSAATKVKCRLYGVHFQLPQGT